MEYDAKRLQMTRISLGGSIGDSSLLKLDFNYGTTTSISSDNNGSLRKQTITLPGIAPIEQNYTYDQLNRLDVATETVNSTVTWRQDFDYDRFGNRTFNAGNTTTLPANNAVYNPAVNPADNKFYAADGYSYDTEGNLTAGPDGLSMTYNAENKQSQVYNAATQTTTYYVYDGGGKRVKKTVGNQETYFVYDAFGKLAAEYTTNQTITTEGTKYLTSDLVGSPRATTNNLGQVASRHDYMPFGEEIAATVANRNQVAGFTANDRIRQQFTGYERDPESGLDFAQNRYFAAKHGRFTSVDPLTASASAKNPQTLNRYSYALNSPYKFTDPLGLEPCGLNGTTSGSATGRTCNQSDDHASDRQTARDIPKKQHRGEIGGLMGQIIEMTVRGEDVDTFLSQPESVRNVTCCNGDNEVWYIPSPVENPESLIGKPPVKEPGMSRAECVALCKIYGKLPHTSTWRKGAAVFGNNRLKVGTLIATFGEDGRYASNPHGNHAAIYLGQDDGGIWVIDQWEGLKAIQKRYIRIKDGMSDPSNNARAFSVIAIAVKVPEDKAVTLPQPIEQ